MSGTGPFSLSPEDQGAEDLTTYFARLLATGIPVIVLAGDNLRSQAQKLVERVPRDKYVILRPFPI